jgi:hypothetical protein
LKGRELPQKAVLLLDSAPSNPTESILTSDDGLIVVKFLLPSVTAIIQPMDQRVIASVKQRYWSNLLRTPVNENDNIITLWKRVTVLIAIYGVSQA